MEENVYAGLTDWMPCDAYAAFAFLNPAENILETAKLRLEVELYGPDRGILVASDEDKAPNVVVIQSIDVERFKSACLDLKDV